MSRQCYFFCALLVGSAALAQSPQQPAPATAVKQALDAQAGRVGGIAAPRETTIVAGPKNDLPKVDESAQKPQPVTATAADVLGLSKLVLETSHAHSQQSQDYLRNIFYVLGLVAAGLGFFGFREIKSVMKPYKDKLDALVKAHEAATEEQSKKVDALTEKHEKAMEDQKSVFRAMTESHEKAMAEKVSEFLLQSQINAKALVVASTIWQSISDSEPNTDELHHAVYLIEGEMPDEHLDKLDNFLAGVLLIRKAYVQKRLGDFEGAFSSAKRAVHLNGDGSKNFWLFNTACYAALAGRCDECCSFLAQAIAANPKVKGETLAESDFDGVRNDPRFIAVANS